VTDGKKFIAQIMFFSHMWQVKISFNQYYESTTNNFSGRLGMHILMLSVSF
jgi:hypothetical protein